MKKTFKAFTLVEMLIVMGIVIILMAVGIVAGRFAINRANDVAHQNAADNLYLAAQAYYADFREYPVVTDMAESFQNCADEENNPCLVTYMDEGAFNGGTDATYYYYVDADNNNQGVLICVSLGGFNDASERGYYCAGNAPAGGLTTGGADINEPGTEITEGTFVTGAWTNSTKTFGVNTVE